AAALRALGERPPASALLLGARRASSLEERRAFVTALGESEDPRATGALLALLPDLRLRVSVIEALGARGDRRAQPALARLARGTSRQDVRGALDAALPRLQ
ncbi:MAG TPA: HEAT repeat domain-containing protein, partial [Polyangiaceae bacterium LLY-WYZ-15_(1-7)]|nr:HEAT repeat domain-containing protein [Polyangiaceae bacterium LLY-WYZ-15_(1-7)]